MIPSILVLFLGAADVVDRVAAVVDDAPILLSDVQRRAAPEVARMTGTTDAAEIARRREAMQRRALEVLIDEELLQEQIKTGGGDITDEQVDAAIDDVKKQNNIPDDKAFEQALAHEDMTLKTYRESLRRDLEKRKLLNARVHSQAKVSDDDVRVAYDAEYAKAGGEPEVHARHILLTLPRDASPADDARVRGKAAELAQRIRAGADFQKLAHELSDGPSAAQGGDLGFFRKGVMVAEFEGAAFSLPVGAVSDPIRTQFGYHIIQVVERRQAPPPAFDTVKEQIRQRLQREQIDRLTSDYLASLRKDATIDIKVDSLRPQAAAQHAP